MNKSNGKKIKEFLNGVLIGLGFVLILGGLSTAGTCLRVSSDAFSSFECLISYIAIIFGIGFIYYGIREWMTS